MLLGVAQRLGVFEVVRDSNWRSRRLLILCYHGVSIEDEHEWRRALYIPQQVFRQRLAELRRGSYAVLPFEEAVDRLFADDLPPRSVALTFDDGAHDFRTRACPVLAEFGYPATVYLTTYYAINRYPVFTILFSYLLWKGRGKSVDLGRIIPGQRQETLGSDAQRNDVHQRILAYVEKEKLTNGQQSELASRLASMVGVDYARLCEQGILHIMTPAEVAELSRFNVTVQLHTHRHRTPDDENLFRREIRENRDQIASMGMPRENVRHFCYPSGRYKPEFFGWLEAENVQTATTCVTGLASRKSPRLVLPRLVDTCGVTPLEFEGWLTGTSQFIPRRT